MIESFDNSYFKFKLELDKIIFKKKSLFEQDNQFTLDPLSWTSHTNFSYLLTHMMIN